MRAIVGQICAPGILGKPMDAGPADSGCLAADSRPDSHGLDIWQILRAIARRTSPGCIHGRNVVGRGLAVGVVPTSPSEVP